MEINIKKGDKSVYTAEVKLSKDKVNERLQEALEHEAENVEIKGFRKGKAPLNLVRENIDKSKLRSHALNHLLPDVYSAIIKEHKIAPIIDPRFEIVQFEEDKDMVINVILVEKPEIVLNDYKKAIKERYDQKIKKASKEKKDSKGTEESVDANHTVDKQPEQDGLTNEEIIDIVVKTADVKVADLIIEEESNRMLSSLIDQIARLGLALDKYLESIGKTADQVRKEYMEIAEKTVKADFALTQIAINEGYAVTDEEIEQTINAVPDEKSREVLAKPEQRAYIRAVLTKTKTLTKLNESVKDVKVTSKKEETK